MDDATFQTQLEGLLRDVSSLPSRDQKKLSAVAAKIQERHEKLKATLNGAQESLDYLRLCIKYIVFDLEATRRENKRLREMLENRDREDLDHKDYDPSDDRDQT